MVKVTIAVPADIGGLIPPGLADATADLLEACLAGAALLRFVEDAPDQRVRLGSVDEAHDLVLFEVSSGAGAIWVIGLVTESAAAERWAREHRLRVHPGSGVPAIEGAQRPVEDDGTAALPVFDSLVTVGQLVTDLGVDPSLARRCVDATDEAQIAEIVAQAPQRSQAETLRLLAHGRDRTAVCAELELIDLDPAAAMDDEAIALGLRRNASRMNYALLDGEEPGDLRWMLNGIDGQEWRVFLHPTQRRHVTDRHSGPARLTGGAGTGKTVVLLHRTRALGRRYPGSSIVLTTFSRSLADGLAVDLRTLDPALPIAAAPGRPGIYVGGVDQLAAHVLAAAGDAPGAFATVFGSENRRNLDPGETDKRWQDVLHEYGDALPGPLRNVEFLKREYESVVLANLITELPQYLRVRREGVGTPLDKRTRMAVWEIITQYRRVGAGRRSLDFAEAAAVAAEILKDAGCLVDHTLVDEAQDLSAGHWRLLRRFTRPGPDDIFAAEDAHQRIYERAVVPRKQGVAFDNRRGRLELSYRTTSENLQWAMAVLDGAQFHDLEQIVESHDYRAARSGIHPRVEPVATLRQELHQVSRTVRGWVAGGVAPHEVGVLVRTRLLSQRFTAALSEDGVAVSEGVCRPGHVTVETIYRAKGSEFSRVVLAGAGQGDNPVLRGREAASVDPWTLLGERALIYVAATRARDELVVTWTKEPNQFLPPADWTVPGAPARPRPAVPSPEPWTLDAKQSPSHRSVWGPRSHTMPSSVESTRQRHAGRADDVR